MIDPKIKLILQIANAVSGALLEAYDKNEPTTGARRIRERADNSPSSEMESESNVEPKPIRVGRVQPNKKG